jgi:transposase-like protein
VVPEVARCDVLELACGEEEVFTFGDFPEEHRRQIYSTNPFENVDAYGLGRHPD